MSTARLIYWGWETAALDRGPARVKFIRAIICPPLGCTPRGVEIGEELVISDKTLQELNTEDVVFLGRENALAFEI